MPIARKTFACGDVIPFCQARFTAPDGEAILAQVADHAIGDHGLRQVPAELVHAVRDRIRTLGTPEVQWLQRALPRSSHVLSSPTRR